LLGAARLSAGEDVSTALLADGSLRSCGTELFGELGDGGAFTDARNVPGPVSVLTSGVVQISAGVGYNVATRSDGTVWSWGRRSFAGADAEVPVAVTGIATATAACAGGGGAIALLGDGSVVPFGASAGPAVPGIAGATAIACGPGGHYLALLGNGTVMAWGRNLEGQLGNGSFAPTGAPITTPAAVANLTGVVAIAGGYNHSLALRNDGTVWSWGANANGQLGDGSTTNRNLAAVVPSFTGIVRIAGGGNNSMALRSDGVPFVWGSNDFGELGNGAPLGQAATSPGAVPGLTGVTDLAVGARPDRSTAFAVLADGSVRAWGNNNEGQACVGSGNPLIAAPQAVPGLNVN
jgi:alpha-tubulin suppressor-like RCC1 family protein